MVSVVKRNLTTESRRLVHEPWTSAELGILRRFARAVIAGRYSTAAAAVPRCQAALAGRHTKHSITARLHRCLHELGQPVLNLRWSPEEKAVVDRFARAVVRGEYPNVGEALPNCQRERRRVAPTIERTDVAVAWELLCRAYGHGLARRKHLWTDDELRLLKRHARALADGKYADITTAARHYKAALERAGLAVRQKDGSICARISALARAMGYVSSKVIPCPEPKERRIIAGFSRALARGKYFAGRRAVLDCLHALGPAGLKWTQREDALATLINTGARRLGWKAYGRWNEKDKATVRRHARALAAGRYPTMIAASRACLKSLEDSGHKNLQEMNVRWRLSRCFAATYGRRWQHTWKPEELRILDRFARACILGRHESASAAAGDCALALKRAGLSEHLRGGSVKWKLIRRAHRIRSTT